MSESIAVNAFREHIAELSATWYEGDEAKAFRHAAFHQVVDPNMADAQVIEATAIDKSGDLEIDGWFIDDTSETILLFQSAGGGSQVAEAKVVKFWEAPIEAVDPARVKGSKNQSLKDLSAVLEESLREGFSVRMVFASSGGFAPAARKFAANKGAAERSVKFSDGAAATFSCGLELLDEPVFAKRFEDYRSGFVGESPAVRLKLEPGSSYQIEKSGRKSLRTTVSAAEIVGVFRTPGIGFRLFATNPRGPLANARVNKRIAATLDTPAGRQTFHLLNNGLCAICDDFNLDDTLLTAKNFQIVNGCQTTVTLNSRQDSELQETFVDLKLAVADAALAEEIAIASNSQTALRARDYAAFEKQQRTLAYDFEHLQPPWYYEVKQGYWRYVLSDKEKAKFKTGKKKRHIEVQPLAQASLSFSGNPSEALDRIRFVFEGIRNPEERHRYEEAFPPGISAYQLLLPWRMLDYLERNSEGRLRFSTFHVIWLMADLLRDHYGIPGTTFFSNDLTRKLLGDIEDWMGDLTRVANTACSGAFQRAQNIMGGAEELDLRSFFRASGDLAKGVNPSQLLGQSFDQEMKIEHSAGRDPMKNLPALP